MSEKRFVNTEEVETQIFPWGRLEWLSEPRVTGTDNMTAGVVTLEVGKGHESHNHEGIEEILYVLEGEGQQKIELDDEVVEKTVKKGDLINIPAGAFHETMNTGDKAMKIFAVYQYPGPEQELRSLPECEIEPPSVK